MFLVQRIKLNKKMKETQSRSGASGLILHWLIDFKENFFVNLIPFESKNHLKCAEQVRESLSAWSS